MRKYGIGMLLWMLSVILTHAQLNVELSLKVPGNKATTYQLSPVDGSAEMKAEKEINAEVLVMSRETPKGVEYRMTITAKENIWFNLSATYQLADFNYEDCQFYLPGFWYNKNLRSPDYAPTIRKSESWTVREDRLSTPLSAIYDGKGKAFYSVLRTGNREVDALATHTAGEVILSGESHVGYVGFGKRGNVAELRFGMPSWEAPYVYIRKGTLAPEVKNFLFLKKGDTRMYTWMIQKNNAEDYAEFISKAWQYSYDEMQPTFLSNQLNNKQVQHILAQFFSQSFETTDVLNGFAGEGLKVDLCEVKDALEVGFVGRVLLNAFNCMEYGEAINDPRFTHMSEQIFDSYLKNGFNEQGFIREYWTKNGETDVYSLRRQAEGAYAVLLYLNYEKKQGRKHPEWEKRIRTLMDNLVSLQNEDFSFPRKFKADKQLVDKSAGSTPCAIPTLTMAAHFLKEKSYLKVAKSAAQYVKTEIVDKSDYFSSTLDANCEDKEASYYAATAFYYLALNAKGTEKEEYIRLAKKSAYFAASWYYLWDVPFAQGQMLGDLEFHTRGWGNVSVENNHVDVFVFDLASVLDWLSTVTDEHRFAELSTLMRTSMHEQLLPWPGHLCGVAKVGYHPEVVQHTNWDYGRNGKGYYNDIFAPGWVVASLWQLLMPDRVASFFEKK